MYHRLLPVCALAAFAVTACSPAPEEDPAAQTETGVDESALRIALQSYFDAHRVCTPFFKMPMEVRDEPGSYRIRQLDSFVAAGLLRRGEELVKPHEVTGTPERLIRFETTGLGREFIGAGTDEMFGNQTVICYGRRKVETVTHDGVNELSPDRLSVKFMHRLVDIPAWTRAASIAAMYPGLAQRLSEAPESDSEDLARVGGKWILQRQTAFGVFDFRQDSH